MPLTVLKIAWPFLQRFLVKRAAEHAADYLNRRRDRRLHGDVEPVAEAPAGEPSEQLPRPAGYAAGDVVWFTLSGMLLGSAFAVMLARLFGRED